MAKAKVKDPHEQLALQVAKDSDKAIGPVTTYKVTNQAMFDQGLDILKAIKKDMANTKAQKDTVLGPAKETVARINALFKPIEDKQKALDAAVRAAMKEFADKQAAKVKKVEQDLSDGKIKKVATAVEKTTALKTGGTMTKKVLYIDNENQIPRGFLVPDESAIKESWRMGIPVPGTRWEDELVIAAR